MEIRPHGVRGQKFEIRGIKYDQYVLVQVFDSSGRPASPHYSATTEVVQDMNMSQDEFIDRLMDLAASDLDENKFSEIIKAIEALAKVDTKPD